VNVQIHRDRRLSLFERFAGRAIATAGHSSAFGIACAVVLAWLVSGPLFGFSETWQLNELIASHELASNHVISIEDLSEEELQTLQKFYAHLAELADKEGGVKRTHSLDDALRFHTRKRERRGL
jgi:low affinity Fe/Cu permease